MKYGLPQEIEVWYVIPAIRNELAKSMRNLGLRQKEIAKILNLRESAVSQYLSSKRGNDISFNKKIKTKIYQSAKDIMEQKTCVIKEIQNILKEIRMTKTLCKIHKKYSNLTHCCGFCMEV